MVNNLESLIGRKVVDCGWLGNSIFWVLRNMLFYSKCVKICWSLVDFTRVGSVKGSPAIRGDTEYLDVDTVSSDVKLYRPGIVDRVIWHWVLTDARISSSHLNICWRQFWSHGLERCWKRKTSEVIWMLLMITVRSLGWSSRTVYTASWSAHFPEVNWELLKTVRSSSYTYNPSFIISWG